MKTPDPMDKHVGNRIRVARVEAGITQTALGDVMKLSFQQIQKYEKGTNRVAPSRLVKIAEKLRKPVTWFYDGVGGIETAAASAGVSVDLMGEFLASRLGVRMAAAFISLPEPLKPTVVDFFERVNARQD